MKKCNFRIRLFLRFFFYLVMFSMLSVCVDEIDKVKANEKDPPDVSSDKQLKDLLILKERLTDMLVPDRNEIIDRLPSDVMELMKIQSDDGSWPDINYSDRSNAIWTPMEHLNNILSLTRAYVQLADKPENREIHTQLRDKIDRGLSFWFTRDPQSDNWWYNMIGAQIPLSKIGLLLDNEMTQEQRAGFLKILAHAKIGKRTGANLTWIADINVVSGVLARSPEIIAKALRQIANAIRISPGIQEGIKIDGSFHQHGQQLYNGGYGSAYIITAARFLSITSGTVFEFPREKTKVLDTFVLDGTRWMLWKNIKDYSVCGREITRPLDETPGLAFLAKVCRNLKDQPSSRQGEIKAFYNELINKQNSLCGNRYFWKSDYMVHRRIDWMISVKMLSRRMISGELVNEEGRKSNLLSDGLTYIYTGDGLAYHNIFPVWDWKLLPGITAEWSQEPPQGAVKGRYSRGTGEVAGGVSDGIYGACAFKLERNSLKARKAWFFFDKECVAIGAGICCNSDQPVFTSINQCLLKDDVIINNGSEEKKVGLNTKLEGNFKWVYHNNTGYLLSQNERSVLKVSGQTGSWHLINGTESSEELSMPVFSLWIDHRVRPENESYQYIIVPKTLAEFQNYITKVPVNILTNTQEIQAVEHLESGIVEAVFYNPGNVTSGRGITISVDQPSIVMIRPAGNKVSISAANPANQPMTLNLTINMKLTGEYCLWQNQVTIIKIILPGGDYAGQSVTRIFSVEKL